MVFLFWNYETLYIFLIYVHKLKKTTKMKRSEYSLNKNEYSIHFKIIHVLEFFTYNNKIYYIRFKMLLF